MVSEINPGGNTDAPAINTGGVEVSNNLKFNLNDIDSFDNANIKSVEAFLDNELQGYRKAPLKRGDGVRYYDGKGNSWQLNYGYENATDIYMEAILKTTYNGEIVRIPLQNKEIKMDKIDLIELLQSFLEEDAIVSRIFSYFCLKKNYNIALLNDIISIGLRENILIINSSDEQIEYDRIEWKKIILIRK